MLTQDKFPHKPVQPAPGTGNNLPGSLARKPTWNHPVMRWAKLICWLFAQQRAGGEGRLTLNRKWSSLGINGSTLLQAVRRLNPSFDEQWVTEGRSSDPADALMNRLWYMYRHRVKGTPHAVISAEHPLRSRRLAPFVEAAVAAYTRNRPLTRREVEELFS
jgi:hypothetical protein